MATYYVSNYGANSGNNGLGPDPTNGTNKPYLTITKAISVAVAGDVIYVGPGVYRETVTVSTAYASVVKLIGDPTNAQGFKNASGVSVVAGEVRLTAYTTNDSTAPSASITFTMNGGNMAISNLWIIGGSSLVVTVAAASQNVTFTDCMFTGNTSSCFQLITPTAGAPSNYTFDRCIFQLVQGVALGIFATRTSSGAADFNLNILIQNCLFIGGLNQITVGPSGSGTFLGGGVTIVNCTFIGGGNAVNMGTTGTSITYPVSVTNSILFTAGYAMYSASSGQLTEDYNHISSPSPRNLVNVGPHSNSDGSHSIMLECGQSRIWGQYTRLFGVPTINSVQLGMGTTSGMPTYDFQNRGRPEGGASLNPSVGYLERHDTGVRESVIVDSGLSVKLVGPSSHEFNLPLNATASTISVKCEYDALHGNVTPPQVWLMASPLMGVADNFSPSGINQIVTAPSTSGVFNTLTFSPVTPSANGVIGVRVFNRSVAPSGNAYFDTFSVG